MFKVLHLVTKHRPLESFNCARQLARTFDSPRVSTTGNHLSVGCNVSFVKHLSSNSKMVKALLVIADGTEDMEAVITVDILRRANIKTTIAGLKSAQTVVCSQGVKIIPDMSLEEAAKTDHDAIVLPGGLEGSSAFCNSSMLGELLKKQEAAGRYCAAICAAPTAFKHHGIGEGKSITCYPGLAEKFDGANYKYVEDQSVVVDGKLVTSVGPSTVYDFAFRLVELLVGVEAADSIRSAMLLDD